MTGRRGALRARDRRARHRALGHLRARRRASRAGSSGARRAASTLTPYASLQPEVVVVRRVRRVDGRLGDAGARAGLPRRRSCEATFSGPYVAQGPPGPDDRVVEVVARRARGGRAGHDAHGRRRSTPSTRSSGRCGVAERARRATTSSSSRRRSGSTTSTATPSWRRARRSASPQASGSRPGTSSRDLIDRPGSPSCSRTSAASAGSPRRGACATWRRSAGRLVVPHAWKTGISVAVAAHLAMVDAAHAVLRVPAGRAVRVAAAQGADPRRARVRQRTARGPPRARAWGSSSTATALREFAEAPRVSPDPRAAHGLGRAGRDRPAPQTSGG